MSSMSYQHCQDSKTGIFELRLSKSEMVTKIPNIDFWFSWFRWNHGNGEKRERRAMPGHVF